MFKKVFNLLIIIMVFGLLFLKKENTVFAQEIIPSDRRIDWSYAGIPGGIPNRTTICTTIDPAVYGNGTTDATAAIQTALNNCPNDQVVYLPAGNYRICGTISLHTKDILRGAGPGSTKLIRSSSCNSNNSSIVTIKNPYGLYIELIGDPTSNPPLVPIIHNITLAEKDAKVLTLDSTAGIAVGDVLLLNQLNDGNIVNSTGSNGKCTFCGLARGDRSLGQMVEVTGVSGNQVNINLPLHWRFGAVDPYPDHPDLQPWAYQVDADAMVRWAGLEDLTVTQEPATTLSKDMIFLEGAQYCWIKNVEITKVDSSSVFGYYVIQSEFQGLFMHETVSGIMGQGQGYGLGFSMYSTNNLIDNNISADLDGGGLETHGGASGNVFAYNYLYNIIYSYNSNWMVGSPQIEHGAHPKMNLWEGNSGYMAQGDWVWGSSSHNTIFRSQSKGWLKDSISNNNAAIRFGPKNYYMNVVGSVLGTPGKSNKYEELAGQPYNGSLFPIWVLGISENVVGGAPDSKVAETFYRHGNFDYVTNSTVWDPNNSNHALPNSLYLTQKPYWWCNETPWPPIGPDVEGLVNAIPAQRRFENLPCTLNGNQTPLPTLTPIPTPKPGDGNGDGQVNELDYNIWRLNYNQNLTGPASGDFNSSGKVDGVDYVIWLLNFGN